MYLEKILCLLTQPAIPFYKTLPDPTEALLVTKPTSGKTNQFYQKWEKRSNPSILIRIFH